MEVPRTIKRTTALLSVRTPSMRRSRWDIGVVCMSILQWVSISARANFVG
jgi:hypothetical protein